MWLIGGIAIFIHTLRLKKKVSDKNLMKNSNYKFIMDADCTFRITNKEKKRYKWFRVLSYISVVLNISLLLL
jgi:hypothetical protein